MDRTINTQLENYISDMTGSSVKTAKITAAYVLQDAELQTIKSALPILQKLDLSVEVNPGILAGIIIQVGSVVVDLSLQTKLRNYFKTLYDNL